MLFESSNTTHREILLDSIQNAQTYATYDIETNTITATRIEGNVIDENSSDVFLGVYVKQTSTSDAAIPSMRVIYDDSKSNLGVDNMQDAIDKLDEKVDNMENVIDRVDTIESELGITLTTTLSSGQTSLTFTDERITVNSILDSVYTSIFGVAVKSAVFAVGKLTLTFSAQTTAMTVKVVIK